MREERNGAGECGSGGAGERRSGGVSECQGVGGKVAHFKDLRVFQNAMDGAVEIFEITKKFPKEEQYSMASQFRRSSRSVCANIAEAWRKRRYKAAFIAKLSDAEAEAAETLVWTELSLRSAYIVEETALKFEKRYEHILAQIVLMIDHADQWLIRVKK